MVCTARLCFDHNRSTTTPPQGVLSLQSFKALIAGPRYTPDRIRGLLTAHPEYQRPAYREAAERFIAARTPADKPTPSDASELDLSRYRLALIAGGQSADGTSADCESYGCTLADGTSSDVPVPRPAATKLTLVANPTRLVVV